MSEETQPNGTGAAVADQEGSEQRVTTPNRPRPQRRVAQPTNETRPPQQTTQPETPPNHQADNHREPFSETNERATFRQLMQARGVAERVSRIAEQNKLSEIKPEVVIRNYETLRKAVEAAERSSRVSDAAREELRQALQLVEEHAIQRSDIDVEALERDQLHTRPTTFHEQLINQWAQATWGGDIEITHGSVKGITVRTDEHNRVTVVLPDADSDNPPTLDQLSEITRKIAPKLRENGSQNSRTEVYLRKLRDTAIYLAKQHRDNGAAWIHDDVIEELYNTAIKMQSALDGKAPPEVIARAQIEKAELIPPLYQTYKKYNQSYVENDAYQQAQQVYGRELFAFALGKDARALPGQESFHEKLYQHTLQHNKTADAQHQRTITVEENGQQVTRAVQNQEDLDIYLQQHSIMGTLAKFVNEDRLSQQRRREAIAEHVGQSMVEEAISKRGSIEQQKILDTKRYQEVMTFSPEIGQDMAELTSAVLPEATLQERLNEELARFGDHPSDEQKLRSLTRAIERTFQIPTEQRWQEYAPILALENGEFRCTIQTLVAAQWVERMFDRDENGKTTNRFVLLGDSGVFGHEQMFLLDTDSLQEGNTPQGFFMSTGGKNGYGVARVTDQELAMPFLAKLAEHYKDDPESILAYIELVSKDNDLEQEFGIYHALTNINASLEAAIWNNLAATLPGLSNEERNLFLQRGLVRDPNNITLLAQLASISGGAMQRTLLEKIRALDPTADPHELLEREREEYTQNTAVAEINALPAGGYPDIALNIDALKLAAGRGKLNINEIEGAQARVFDKIGVVGPDPVLDDIALRLESARIELEEEQREQVNKQSYLRQGVKEEDIPTIKTIEKVVGDYKTGANENKVVAVDDRTTEAIYLLKRLINDYSPNGNRFPDTLLELAGEFDETREMLINRILFSPYLNEVAGYDLNILVTDPRLESLIQSFRTEAARVRSTDPDAADRYLQLYEQYRNFKPSVKLFYAMNQTIVTGDIQGLTKSSAALTKDQFVNYTKVVPAFGLAMNLYEEEFLKMQAREKVLTSKLLEEIADNVKSRLKSQSKQGLIRSDFEGRRNNDKYKDLTNAEGNFEMEDWEVERAFYVGRTLFHVFLRSGVHLAVSDLPKGVDVGNSPPENAIANTMNFWGNVLDRWDIGAVQGGPEFSADFYQSWSDAMTDMGYSIRKSNIFRIGGVRVDNMRRAQWSMINDFLTAWRVAAPAFPSIYMDNGKNLYEYLNPKIQQFRDWYKAGNEKQITKALKEIVDNTGLGLGPLVTYETFWGSNPKYGYEGRKYLWQKVADINAPLMADYLTGLEFAVKNRNGSTKMGPDGKPLMRPASDYDIQTLEEILRGTRYIIFKKDMKTKEETWEFTDDWKGSNGLRQKMEFERRLFEINEMNKAIRMNKAKGNPPLNKDDEEIPLPAQDIIDAMEYTPKEKAIVEKIKKNGKKLAGQLADVQWNTVPFMDIPFQYLQFDRFGSDEYDRKVKDTASEAQAGNNVYNELKNPGGIDEKALFEILGAVRAGMEDPEGSKNASERERALIEAKGKWDLARKALRWGPVHMIVKGLHIPILSESQEFAGPDANAMIEVEMSAQINAMQKAGYISKEDAKKLKKKLGVGWFWLLVAFLRDVGVFSPAMVGKLLFDEVAPLGGSPAAA